MYIVWFCLLQKANKWKWSSGEPVVYQLQYADLSSLGMHTYISKVQVEWGDCKISCISGMGIKGPAWVQRQATSPHVCVALGMNEINILTPQYIDCTVPYTPFFLCEKTGHTKQHDLD